MKQFYPLISLLFFLTLTAQAQQVASASKVLYEQNLTTSPTNLSGSKWAVGNTYLFAPNNTTSGNFLKTDNTLTTNRRVFVVQEPVSTLGLAGVTVTWKEFRTQHWIHNDNGLTIKRDKQNSLSTKIDNTNPIVLEYSFDGITYTSEGITVSQNITSFYTWAPVNSGNLIFLPDHVLNKEKVYFRWSIVVDATNQDFYAMDDIRIVGEQDQAVAPLPVQLMSFKGSVQGANVNLTWATAQELDNDKFVVERSLDGRSFSEIGKVTGRGNSSTRINYTFTDTNPAEGINYYRLRQVDFDGAEETSNVVALQFKGTQHTLNGNIAKVYPTITSSDVTVSFALRNAQVTVLNANGQQVAQYGNVNNAVVVPAAHLHPGIYFVKVSDGTQQQTQRFVKQ